MTAVVLVHGIVGARYFEPVAQRLAADFDVHNVELPGFGRTPAEGRVRGVPELAQWLAGHVEEAGLASPALGGHSMGCQVVAHYAAGAVPAPPRVALIGPTFEAGRRARLVQFGRWLRCVPREPLAFQGVIAREAAEASVVHHLRTFSRFLDDAIETKLPRISAPLLFVRGEHDFLSSRPWVDRLAALSREARVVEIPGASHSVNYSHPDAVADVVRSFLSGGDG